MGFRQPVGPMALDLSWVMELVLVCSSCQNQIPQARWLKQRTLSFSQFRILEVQDQGDSKFNSWWKHSSCIVVHHLLSVSSHNISSGYVWRKRERSLVSLPLIRISDPMGWGPHSYNLCVCCTWLLSRVRHLAPHDLWPTRLLCPWEFSRQEHWSGLPCPPPGDLPITGIEPRCPALQADSLPSRQNGSPRIPG